MCYLTATGSAPWCKKYLLWHMLLSQSQFYWRVSYTYEQFITHSERCLSAIASHYTRCHYVDSSVLVIMVLLLRRLVSRHNYLKHCTSLLLYADLWQGFVPHVRNVPTLPGSGQWSMTGMASPVCATGHIKDPVPLLGKRRALYPGGRFAWSCIHTSEIIITDWISYNTTIMITMVWSRMRMTTWLTSLLTPYPRVRRVELTLYKETREATSAWACFYRANGRVNMQDCNRQIFVLALEDYSILSFHVFYVIRLILTATLVWRGLIRKSYRRANCVCHLDNMWSPHIDSFELS